MIGIDMANDIKKNSIKKRDECPRCLARPEQECLGMDDDDRGIIPFQICGFCGNVSSIPIYSDEEAEAVIELLRIIRNGQYITAESAYRAMHLKFDSNRQKCDPVRYK